MDNCLKTKKEQEEMNIEQHSVTITQNRFDKTHWSGQLFLCCF